MVIEKVNPCHPDKVADRIAGALVDLAYTKSENPKIAVEVLIGHGVCHIIAETSEILSTSKVEDIVDRIAGEMQVDFIQVPQDVELAKNQSERVKCGDNGIFKGVPLTKEEKEISEYARDIYSKFPTDGKYVLSDDTLIVCQSNANTPELISYALSKRPLAVVNPLGDWTGGTNVDTGATNRKLGSDMGQSVTGGGLHGKDLSKADVSVNIYAFLKAQETGEPVELFCAIGDEFIDNKPYSEIVDCARRYITEIGGFEKLAEWGLF